MNEITKNIAKKHNILDRCIAFENELLGLKDIVTDKFDSGIPFDLSCLESDIDQVIIVPKYDICGKRGDYWNARSTLKENVIELAKKYDLHKTDDGIEDYGEHFYFVFSCGESW